MATRRKKPKVTEKFLPIIESKYKLNFKHFNLTDKQGWYVNDITTNKQTGNVIEFKEKEGKWFGALAGDTTDGFIFGSSTYNLDQSEFSVQGLGTATWSFPGGNTNPHGPPAQATTRIRVKNRPQVDNANWPMNAYGFLVGNSWDATPDDTYQSDTVPYSLWEVSDDEIMGSVGVPIPSQVINLTISNIINGVYSGYNLNARDFAIGGQNPTTNLAPNLQATSAGGVNYYQWSGAGSNFTQEVTKVVFSDNGIPSDPANTINVAVYIDSFTITMQQVSALSPVLFPVAPNGTQEISIDIDVQNPPIVLSHNVCSVGLTTIAPSSNSQTVTTTSIPNITSTLTQIRTN